MSKDQVDKHLEHLMFEFCALKGKMKAVEAVLASVKAIKSLLEADLEASKSSLDGDQAKYDEWCKESKIVVIKVMIEVHPSFILSLSRGRLTLVTWKSSQRL